MTDEDSAGPKDSSLRVRAAVACLLEKSERPLYRYKLDVFLWPLPALAATELLARRRERRAEADVRH